MAKTRGKTERDILNAFLALLSEKQFNTLSTTDIADKAEVSRSTFYSYYDSKHDLLETITDDLISGFVTIMIKLREAGRDKYYNDIKSGYCEFFVQYFRYIRKNHDVFKALLHSNDSINFMPRFSKAITKARLETIRIWNNLPSIEVITSDQVRIYREEILSSLYVSIFATWIARNMDLSDEKMARMLIRVWVPLADFKI